MSVSFSEASLSDCSSCVLPASRERGYLQLLWSLVRLREALSLGSEALKLRHRKRIPCPLWFPCEAICSNASQAGVSQGKT